MKRFVIILVIIGWVVVANHTAPQPAITHTTNQPVAARTYDNNDPLYVAEKRAADCITTFFVDHMKHANMNNVEYSKNYAVVRCSEEIDLLLSTRPRKADFAESVKEYQKFFDPWLKAVISLALVKHFPQIDASPYFPKFNTATSEH